MEESKDVKCGKCKSYKCPSQFFKEGRRMKTCSDCRERDRKYRQSEKSKETRAKYKQSENFKKWKNKQRISCDCGIKLYNFNLSRHKESKEHQDRMKYYEQNPEEYQELKIFHNGEKYGYSNCCINSFLQQAHGPSNCGMFQGTKKEGFIPCNDCFKKVIEVYHKKYKDKMMYGEYTIKHAWKEYQDLHIHPCEGCGKDKDFCRCIGGFL